jgi:hypothetical protein
VDPELFPTKVAVACVAKLASGIVPVAITPNVVIEVDPGHELRLLIIAVVSVDHTGAVPADPVPVLVRNCVAVVVFAASPVN